MKILLKEESIREKGTLSQIRNQFHHSAASTNVSSSFTHTEDLLRFATEAHVVLLAMVILDLDDPAESPTTELDKLELLKKVSQQIRERAWSYPTPEEFEKVVDGDEDATDNWCFCGEGIK
jgi:hypothetical protein